MKFFCHPPRSPASLDRSAVSSALDGVALSVRGSRRVWLEVEFIRLPEVFRDFFAVSEAIPRVVEITDSGVTFDLYGHPIAPEKAMRPDGLRVFVPWSNLASINVWTREASPDGSFGTEPGGPA